MDVGEFAKQRKSLCVIFSLLKVAWLIVDRGDSRFRTHVHSVVSPQHDHPDVARLADIYPNSMFSSIIATKDGVYWRDFYG